MANYISYKLFVFNSKIDKGIENISNIKALKEAFGDFLLQNRANIHVEVINNQMKEKAIEQYFLTSLDKKWLINFDNEKLAIIYSHDYPTDTFSFSAFKEESLGFYEKLDDILQFGKSYRLGIVTDKITEINLNSECETNEEIIEKINKKVKRVFCETLNEKINVSNMDLFNRDLKINLVHKTGFGDMIEKSVHTLDVNTIAEDLTERFDLQKIQYLFEQVESHLGES